MDEGKALETVKDDSVQNSTEPTLETASLAPQSADFPDGGMKAWLTVLGGWLVMFCAFGYTNSFGVYQSYYTQQGASSASGISWIGSLQLFLTFFLSLPAGKLVDRGYFHHTVFAGSVLFVFCLFMLSLADPRKYYQLILAQGVGMGLGGGLLLVPAQSVQGHHWKKRRALALGIVMTGSSLGGVIFPIILNQLINGPAGFAWGVRATAFMTLGLLAIANCTMTPRLPSAKERGPAPTRPLKPILADVAYVLLIGGNFLALCGVYYPYFYLQLWVTRHGLSTTLAFYSLAILNASSVPGRIILNFAADRLGAFNVLGPTIAIIGALIFAMFGVTSTAGVVVFAILYGFFSGAYISLLPPTFVSLARDVDEIGFRLGLAYFVASFAFLAGTPIDGALLGSTFQWFKPIVFSGVMVLAGSVVVVTSRFIYAKRKGTGHV